MARCSLVVGWGLSKAAQAAEDALAHWCLGRREAFKGKEVCELGAGMAGLVGFAVAIGGSARAVHITDGNERSAQSLARSVAANAARCGDTATTADVLCWDRDAALPELAARFHTVLVADCLFFRDVHVDLVHTIATLLRPGGRCIMAAPRRSGSLEAFVEVAAGRFHVSVQESWLSEVDEAHARLMARADGGYDPDTHRPLFLQLTPRDA